MLISGVYEHYKGGRYLAIGVGRNTETNELLVAYVPLYQHPNGGPPLQFRPFKMWDSFVGLKEDGTWEDAVSGKAYLTVRKRFETEKGATATEHARSH